MSKSTVLLAGASGRFGAHVARALLARPDVALRVLARDASSAKLAELRAAGATIVEGDLRRSETLDAAVAGAEVVVSTLNGGPEVIVEGQSNLLRASERNGVARFLPSDYSLDHFALADGDNVFLDLRRAFARTLEGSRVRATHVMVGAFTEVQLSPFYGIFDFERATATTWGTGDEPVDVTTLADAGRVVAEVALDRAAPRRIEFAGDVITVKGIAASYAEITGWPMTITSRGSIAELEAWIARTRATAKSPMEFVFGQYQLAQINGKGKLRATDLARFPSVQPTRAVDVLRGWLSSPAGAR